MSIEVTSVPDTTGFFHFAWLRQGGQSLLEIIQQTRHRLLLRFSIGLIAVGMVIAGDAFLRSYKYYSRIIDARLASGYLSSRPGLYAAPRILHPGQKYSIEKLVQALRRAGYVESRASEVWSGGFIVDADSIEIQPAGSQRKQPRSVTVKFDGEQISEIVSDGTPLNSLALEPEPLSNDLSYKSGKREVLTFKEIPTVLVNAILAIEDRRFFDHSGRGLCRFSTGGSA